MRSRVFVWGVRALDELLPDALTPGTTLVVAGPPGAGKTILASTICYANASRGDKCLYLSHQEPYDKYVRIMKRLGMDFEELRRRGLFTYEQLSLLTDPDSLLDVLEDIGDRISRMDYHVVVVDSVTPLISPIGSDVRAREVYVNFFYNLARLRHNLTVLVGEASGEGLGLQGLDYVADVVVLLKYRITRGFLNRLIEIRKARGSPVYLAEIPFSIVDGRGMVVHTPPPLMKEVPALKSYEVIELPCKALREAIGPIPRGSCITVFHEADAQGQHLLAPFLATLVLKSRLRMLFISYAYNPSDVLERLTFWVPSNLKSRVAERLLGSGLLRIMSINPSAMSLSEIYSVEMSEIEDFNPDIVVFDRTELPYLVHGLADNSQYVSSLRNELLALRARNITVIRSHVIIDRRLYRINASMSNIVIRTGYRVGGSRIHEPFLYIWRENSSPRIIDGKGLELCRQEAVETVKALFEGGS